MYMWTRKGFENMDNKEQIDEEVNDDGWKGTTFVVMTLMLSLIIFSCKKKTIN